MTILNGGGDYYKNVKKQELTLTTNSHFSIQGVPFPEIFNMKFADIEKYGGKIEVDEEVSVIFMRFNKNTNETVINYSFTYTPSRNIALPKDYKNVLIDCVNIRINSHDDHEELLKELSLIFNENTQYEFMEIMEKNIYGKTEGTFGFYLIVPDISLNYARISIYKKNDYLIINCTIAKNILMP